MPIADCVGRHLCVCRDLKEEPGYTLSLGPHLVSWNEGPGPRLRLKTFKSFSMSRGWDHGQWASAAPWSQ